MLRQSDLVRITGIPPGKLAVWLQRGIVKTNYIPTGRGDFRDYTVKEAIFVAVLEDMSAKPAQFEVFALRTRSKIARFCADMLAEATLDVPLQETLVIRLDRNFKIVRLGEQDTLKDAIAQLGRSSPLILLDIDRYRPVAKKIRQLSDIKAQIENLHATPTTETKTAPATMA